MLLFPYAKDVEYENKHLSFVIQLMNKTIATEVSITIRVDDDLSELIEDLLNTMEEF